MSSAPVQVVWKDNLFVLDKINLKTSNMNEGRPGQLLNSDQCDIVLFIFNQNKENYNYEILDGLKWSVQHLNVFDQ